MYTWGDDTGSWKNPGYDYGSARRAYVDPAAPPVSRSYSSRASPKMDVVGPKKDVSSDSKNPVIVGIDCTGSMADWPAEIFDRLPLFCQTLAKYKPDVEIMFAVIGDANSDNYPLQVAKFGKGTELDDILKSFFPEGNGGGQHFESYEMFAYYLANHVKTPNAVSPYALILGDEGFYEFVNPAQVKHYLGDTLQSELDSFAVWKTVAQKYNVFYLHKDYDGGGLDKEIVAQWETALSKQKVIRIPSKERAVDVGLGLIAKGWGQFSDFIGNISSRHDPATVARVLNSVSAAPAIDPSLNSTVSGRKSGRAASSKLA